MPIIDSNMYLLLENDSALVVDPCISDGAERLLRGRSCLVLLTHEHYDHISGVNWLRERAECQVVCSAICAERMRDPKKNTSAYFEALFFERDEEAQRRIRGLTDPTYSCQADISYVGRKELEWEGLNIEMVEAPGHSPGSQIIRVNGRYYFTGDYLIPGESVITRFPGGSKGKYETVAKPYLQRIEQGSYIFPGHGQPGVFSEAQMSAVR